MANSHQDSSLQLELGPWPELEDAALDVAEPAANGDAGPAGEATIWLNGEVLACACPACLFPMTIRLWLMTADCFRCNTSIELTIEQEREARRLLERQQQAIPKPPPPPAPHGARQPQSAPRPKPKAKSPSRPREAPPEKPAPERTKAPAKPAPPAPKKRTAPPSPPLPERVPTKPARAPAAPPVAAPQTQGPAAPPVAHSHAGSALAAEYRASDWLKDLPAWLASLVFHLLLMILLGLWTLGKEEESPVLVLSLTIGPHHAEGGEVVAEEEVNVDEFDLPVDKEPETEQEKEALVKADQDARELRMDPHDSAMNLPDLARVKADLVSADPYRRMHAARDPRVRAELVAREGGTTMTEAAVARALRWMSRHQNDDGSWSLHRFHRAGDCNGQCDNAGSINSDTAATAMVLMAMLGTGQTHRAGIYREQVSRGLRWLVDHQKSDGDLRHDGHGNAGMYAHGQAAIVLCDAFKLTGDEALRAPAQRSIDFICKAQHARGGWRYRPGDAGDTSVVGWQLMAMHSAKAAYLHVPKENTLRAGDFLDSVSDRDGALYSYQPRGGPTPTMTAEGLLSRMYLGWGREERGLQRGVEHLVKDHLPSTRRSNIYYWYYATQVMHHWGGEPWEKWNVHMRDVLVSTQETSGHQAGSWHPNDPHGRQGGRLYMTALAACTLEVYYRYAPLYYKLDLD